MSIQLRTILVLNLFVAGLAAVMGYIARETAGRIVEERLASQLAVGVSTFLQNQSFPLSDTMMNYLRDMFNTDWAATDAEGTRLVGSSLPGASAEQFRTQIQAAKTTGRAALDGRLYRVPSKTIVRRNPDRGEQGKYQLFMLVPDAQLEAARNEAAAQMFKVFLPAIGAATVVAFLLSFTIARPIRRLSGERPAAVAL